MDIHERRQHVRSPRPFAYESSDSDGSDSEYAQRRRREKKQMSPQPEWLRPLQIVLKPVDDLGKHIGRLFCPLVLEQHSPGAERRIKLARAN